MRGWFNSLAACLMGLSLACDRPAPPPAAPDGKAEVNPQIPVPADEQERVVYLVKQARREEDGVAYGAWIETQLAAEKETVLFQNWSVTRRGEARFEVRFIYTLLGEDTMRRQKGYSWNVDELLNVVSAPRELTAGAGTRGPARPTPDRVQSQQDQYYSLE